MEIWRNPMETIKELSRSRASLKLFGKPQNSEFTPDDLRTIQELKTKIRSAYENLVLEMTVAFALAGTGYGLHRVADSIGNAPLSGTLQSDSAPSPTAEVLHDIQRRQELVREDPRNHELLINTEPKWRTILAEWLEELDKGNFDSKPAFELYQFFLDYGVPMIFYPENEVNIANLRTQNHFAFDTFDTTDESKESDRHKWFHDRKIPYYDHHTQTLYFVPPRDIEKYQRIDIWFALNDVFTQNKFKTIWFSDPRLRKVLAPLGKNFGFLEKDLNELFRRIPPPSIEGALEIIRAIADGYIRNHAQKDPTAAEDRMFREAMMYRQCRFLLFMFSRDVRFQPYLPYLGNIALNPTAITKFMEERYE